MDFSSLNPKIKLLLLFFRFSQLVNEAVLTVSLGIYGIFNFMIVFQVEHNMLMNLFFILGEAGAFGGSLFSVMHESIPHVRCSWCIRWSVIETYGPQQ